MSTTTVLATQGCERCAPHLFSTRRINHLHHGVGISPDYIHYHVWLDGTKQRWAREAYAGTSGWVLVVLPGPSGHPGLRCSCGSGQPRHERLTGRVDIHR